MKKIYLVSILLLSLINDGITQSMNAFIEAAENAYFTKDYYSALIYYNTALEFDENRIDIIYKAAESARMFDAYSDAEEKYQMIVDKDSAMKYPLANFWLADVKQRKGKFEDAKRFFEMYLAEPGENDDPYYSSRAIKEIKSCEWAIELVANPDESIDLTHLEGINTPYSEFGALEREEVLYYSSLQFANNEDTHDPKRLVSKILTVGKDNSPSVIKSDLNDKPRHIAHNSFSRDGKRMYYTECNYINSSEVQCDLYYRNFNGENDFGPAVKLPDFINPSGFTSTQPSIGYDSNLEKEVLFFVSNRDGGVGKLDIWKTIIDENQKFSQPINMVDINTAEDDITPFYHADEEVLYFSSTGYQRIGGYDIYKSYFINNKFETPEHLPVPINGSYHDLYYSINEDGNVAHFSSNREGSIYLEEAKKACCFDIFKAEYNEILINLIALTFDANNLQPLPGISVRLVDEDTGELIEVVDNTDENEHLFVLEKGHNYLVIASHSNYISDTVKISTKKTYKSEVITKKIYLKTDKISLDVLTFDKETKEALLGSNVGLFNLLTNELIGQVQLNELSNDFHFLLEKDESYKLMASKIGYLNAEVVFDTNGAKEGTSILKKLFLSKSFLPISLYFDNDIPDIHSVKAFTAKSYTETYNEFVLQKETFKSNFADIVDENERDHELQQLEEFFEIEVKGNYSKLNSFLEYLLNELRLGKELTLSVKGFSSPRAEKKYNLVLAERRIHSLKNEIVRYKGGVFTDYIIDGKFKIENISYGEVLSPTDVSDNLNDKRNSVYSLEASKERRVELISIKYN